MRRIEVSVEARIDVAAALARSYEVFGLAAAERYRALIQQAYADLAADPGRVGVTAPPELPAGVRLYPIRHSRTRLPAGERVGEPRHIIAFRADDERVQIVQLLHDRMDLPGRLRT